MIKTIDKMNKFYIYMYLDFYNIPFYIGKGKNNRYRVSQHLDKNSPNYLLKNKIRKVGADNIKIHFLHKDISEEEAFYWESYWIKYIGRRDLGEGTLCNLTDGGEGESGRTCFEETRQKISKSMRGKTRSTETKQKMAQAVRGRILSDEHKQKISDAHEGKFIGEKNPMYGKSHTEAAKQKIRDARKSQPPPMMGKSHTEETKRKISKSLKKN